MYTAEQMKIDVCYGCTQNHLYTLNTETKSYMRILFFDPYQIVIININIYKKNKSPQNWQYENFKIYVKYKKNCFLKNIYILVRLLKKLLFSKRFHHHIYFYLITLSMAPLHGNT